MLKSVAVLVAVLASGVTASSITQQDQIYIVSGVLGSLCFFLTIAAILSTVAIAKLQTQVAVLQSQTKAAAAAAAADNPRPAPPPRPYRPATANNYY